MKPSAPKLVVITTDGITLRTFFCNQANYLKARGFEIVAVSSPGAALREFGDRTGITTRSVSMSRRISPIRDLCCVIRLVAVLMRIRPHIVHTHTPKAGLLGMLAASLLRVPVRLYTINGAVWATRSGITRGVLVFCDRVAAGLATTVLCVSRSLATEIAQQHISSAAKTRVMGDGGSHGIDGSRYDPDHPDAAVGSPIRAKLGIEPTALVLAFVGRMVLDKGLVELREAWRRLSLQHSDVHLVLCGRKEEGDSAAVHVYESLRHMPRVHTLNHAAEDMPEVYAAVDIGILPTYREGLPNVLLEFGAMRIPVIASSVPGCTDVVIDQVTGLLVPPRDLAALIEAAERLLSDPDLRARMGHRARLHVLDRFSETRISELLSSAYLEFLGQRSARA